MGKLENDQRVRLLKWSYKAFCVSVEQLKGKVADFKLFMRTTDKHKTDRYIV